MEEQQTRLSNSWQLRTAQRAMSIDNISFTPTANMHLNALANGAYQDKENEDNASETGKESRTESRMTNHTDSLATYSAGGREHTENLKETDDENIIPWRAQLRKTNSRLSLIG